MADYTQDANCQIALLMESDEDPLTDSSQNSNTGALKGAGEPDFKSASPPDTYSSGYYDWDGSNDYVQVSDDNSLDFSTNFSIIMWIYRQSDSGFWERVTSKSDSGGDGYDYWFKIEQGDGLEIGVVKAGGAGVYLVDDQTNIGTAGWTHVAATKDSTEFETFVGGSSSDSDITSGTMGDARATAGYNLEIGRMATDPWQYNTDMLLDEFAMFSDVLTSTEVSDIMDNGLAAAAAAVTRRQYLTTNKGYW